jgi:hypothetical protein
MGKSTISTGPFPVVFSCFLDWRLPSGKLLHNYGKSPFLMGKVTISMAIPGPVIATAGAGA